MQGVLRDEKRKNRGAISALEKEANRDEQMHAQGKDFINSDIDWERTHLNKHLIRTDDWCKKLDELYKEYDVKPRKDSVLGFDTVYSASPEYFEQRENETSAEREARIDKFFEDCLEHHIQSKCQGDRNRVINAVIHYDEKTAHMQLFTASIWYDAKKEKYALNCKSIFGNKRDMSARQQSFYDDVLKDRGFDERKIKTEIEPDHKTQAQYRKEQRQKQEQELAELNNSILDKEERQQTLAQSLEELEERIVETKQVLEEYNAERRKADAGLETVKQLNAEIDKITRMHPVPPIPLEKVPAKKNLLGKVLQPDCYLIEAEQYEKYKEETKFQKSDVWNLSKIETAINRLWQVLDGLDVQFLKADLSQKERELNKERQTGNKLQMKIDNLVYDLRQLQQERPDLHYIIENIINPTQTENRTQSRGRGR